MVSVTDAGVFVTDAPIFSVPRSAGNIVLSFSFQTLLHVKATYSARVLDWERYGFGKSDRPKFKS